MMRLHRWSKRIVLALAALPIFQTTGGCDSIIAAFNAQFQAATFDLFISSVQTVLLTNFPSADLLQILFGVNRHPFLNG
jgi:hypothetical protein